MQPMKRHWYHSTQTPCSTSQQVRFFDAILCTYDDMQQPPTSQNVITCISIRDGQLPVMLLLVSICGRCGTYCGSACVASDRAGAECLSKQEIVLEASMLNWMFTLTAQPPLKVVFVAVEISNHQVHRPPRPLAEWTSEQRAFHVVALGCAWRFTAPSRHSLPSVFGDAQSW